MDNEQTSPVDASAVAEPAAPPGESGASDSSALLAELEAVKKELAEAKAKAAENLDGWQRERANFSNYKRRTDREQAEVYQVATGKVIARYLDILDDFDRALKDKPAEGEAALVKWAEGVTLIYRKFQNVLEAEGVVRLEAEGQAFDPNLHEAVVHEASAAHTSGQVIAVLRHGYKLGDRVIRPALVKVAQ